MDRTIKIGCRTAKGTVCRKKSACRIDEKSKQTNPLTAGMAAPVEAGAGGAQLSLHEPGAHGKSPPAK